MHAPCVVWTMDGAMLGGPPSYPATLACPHPVTLEHGVGCVCAASACGTYPNAPWPSSLDEAILLTTSPEHGFLHHASIPVADLTRGRDSWSGSSMDIDVQPDDAFQTILGFGAAVTDAVAHSLTELLRNTTAHEVLLQAFVHANFSMARVPMGAADFSRMDYALAHAPDLSDFCIRDDRPGHSAASSSKLACGDDYKLDVLRQIVALQPNLRLLLSAWSAPPAYKHQNFSCTLSRHTISCSPAEGSGPSVHCERNVTEPEQCAGNAQGVPCPMEPHATYERGFPLSTTISKSYTAANVPVKNADGNCYRSGFVRREAYGAWAGQYARFAAAYAERGVPVWGVTSQNEPYTHTGLWNANFWTDSGMVEFVTNHLAPAVRAVRRDMRVLVHDDQLTSLSGRAEKIARAAADAADGIAYHWYDSLESEYENGEPRASSPIPPGLPLVGGGADVRRLYDAFNGTKFLLQSEACSGYALGTKLVGPRHGDIGFGYNLAHDVMWNMRNRAAGWLYWNLLLDEGGGPNLAGNFVDSPAYVANESAAILNPSFFYLAHFSRAVPPGSRAVHADVKCHAAHDEYCQYVAFRTPRGDIAVVLTNDEVTTRIVPGIFAPRLSKGAGKPLDWTIRCATSGRVANGTLPWKGIQTVVMRCR